jgi:glycosyltransferase involved in cell wall biosynthesis
VKSVKISVVVPSYNASGTILQAIRSVLNQSPRPLEVIVADDGSEDETAFLVKRNFGGSVRVLTLDHGGAARARNRGAELAQGDALLFLDSDDVLGPGTLQALLAALPSRSGGLAFCQWYRLRLTEGDRWVKAPPTCRRRLPGQDLLDAWLDGWYHPPCSVLWSRHAYEEVGGWDDSLTVNDDGDIIYRAFLRRVSVGRSSRGAAYYRKAPEEGGSLSGRRHSREGILSRMRVLEKLEAGLEAEGRLFRHRRALAGAWDRIAGDAPTAQLEDEARRNARRLGGSDSRRRRRERRLTRLRRLVGWVQELRRPGRALRHRVGSAPQAKEVRYGLVTTTRDAG